MSYFFFPKKGLNGCVHLRVIENSSLSSSSFGELVVACHVDWSRYNLYCIVARLEEFFLVQNFQSEKKKVVSRHLWQHFFGLFLQHCNLSCQALFGIRILQTFLFLLVIACSTS